MIFTGGPSHRRQGKWSIFSPPEILYDRRFTVGLLRIGGENTGVENNFCSSVVTSVIFNLWFRIVMNGPQEFGMTMAKLELFTTI
jgi:hypothetical protein